MRFVFVAPRFHTNLYYPVKTLLDHGHAVEFFALYQGMSENHDLIKPQVFGYSVLFRYWSEAKLKYRFPPLLLFIIALYRAHADVLIIKDMVTAYSLLALIFGRFCGQKLVILSQIPKYRRQSFSWSVGWVWWLFHAWVFTPVLGDQRCHNDNPNLIYSPFVIATNSPPARIASHQIRILCVGKFQERKNQLLLVQAVEQLISQFPVHLYLIGEPNEPDYFNQLTNYIHNQGLSSIVTIMPYRLWSEMATIYQNSDLFVLPSSAESAAYSVLEAMAHGLPVISSDDNGTQWYIESKKNGFIFRHDNLFDLTSKLKEAICDQTHLRRMGKASLEFAERHYQPDRFYQQLISVIS